MTEHRPRCAGRSVKKCGRIQPRPAISIENGITRVILLLFSGDESFVSLNSCMAILEKENLMSYSIDKSNVTKSLALAVLCMFSALFAQTATAGTISFRHMYVHDDEEGGVGDWNVTANISPGQNSLHLIANEEAGTDESIDINRDTIFDKYPVTVTIKVEEHDGGIGAEWQPVGTKSKTINGPGNYEIRVTNNEGDVSIYFDVTNTGSQSQSLTEKKKIPYLHTVSIKLESGGTFRAQANNFGSNWKKVVVEFRRNGKYVTAAVAKSAYKHKSSKYWTLNFETPKKLMTGEKYSARLFVWSPAYGPSNSKTVRVVKIPYLHTIDATLKPGMEFQASASRFGSDWTKVGVEFRLNGKYVTAAIATGANRRNRTSKLSTLTFVTPMKLKTATYSVRLFVWSSAYGSSKSKAVKVVSRGLIGSKTPISIPSKRRVSPIR